MRRVRPSSTISTASAVQRLGREQEISMRNPGRRFAIVGLVAFLTISPMLVRIARAEIGTADAVPAATLLLPYFEVDLASASGITTLFSVNNASNTPAVAHVTLWSDQAIPVLFFDVYLTGFDVQTINLRDVLNGTLPRTADSAADPTDSISPQGSLSDDRDFQEGPPGILGPCGATGDVYPGVGSLDAAEVSLIRTALTGQGAPGLGGCVGANYGDNIARGYATIDSVSTCTMLMAIDAAYFTSATDTRNILWGDFFLVDDSENFAQGDTLVHIEACDTTGFSGYVGNGAGQCPLPAGQSFYERYVGANGADQREPLATTFMARYLNGGAFSGGTDLIVWRDTKIFPGGPNGPHDCANQPGWYPLAHSDVVAFDEQENATNLCFLSDNVGPAIGGEQPCFPLATQRISTSGSSPLAPYLAPPSAFGMLYLNLNMSVAGGNLPGVAQAWVSSVMKASGRFSVGFPAVQLDNALHTSAGGRVLIP